MQIESGINRPFLRNSLKSELGHLNIDSKLFAKYQDPSSGDVLDIVLARFSHGN